MESIIRDYVIGSTTKEDFKIKLKNIICAYQYWHLQGSICFSEAENSISFICDDETNDTIQISFKKDPGIVHNEKIVIEFKGTCAWDISQLYSFLIERWHQ